MKALNLRKVAAVTAGLALVVGSVAAATVTLNDLADSTAKTMKVNGLVVGATADASDSLAAGMLAAKLAEKAVYTVKETQTVTEQVCTDNTAFTGKSKKYDTAALAAVTSGVLTYTQLGTDVLGYESTLTYKVGGSTYEAYAKESLGFTTTPTFKTSSKVQRLSAEFSANDLNYDVTFGATDAGIDFNADGAWTSGSTWTDSGASDRVEIPFLGKNYVVHKVTLSGTAIQQLELFEKNAIKTYKKGDKIDNLKGKDGKSYYVVINGITSDSTQASMTLYNAETGAVVEDYENELISETDKFAEDVLESVLEITDIYNLGTTDVPDHSVEMAVGAEAVTVYTGKGFPYDSTKTSTSDYDWIATITSSSSGNETDLTAITLKNSSRYDFKNELGLATSETVEFPGGLAALKFVGLQLPEFNATSPKEVQTFEFGVDVAEGNGTGITYVDASETTHEVPFYYELALDDADSADAVTGADYKVDNFEFDGKTYSLKIVYESDANMDVYLFEGAYAATTVAGDAKDSIADYNEQVNDGVSESQLGINNSEDTAVQYSFFTADVTAGTVWLLLGAQTIDTWDVADITIVGTDVNGESSTFATIDTNAYLPADNGDFETAYNALGTAGAEFDDAYASLFKVTVDVDTTGTDEISMVLDTETGRALAYGASSNASNAIPGPGYQLDDDYANADLQLKKGATNGLEEFYDTFGVKALINSDNSITLVVPEEQAKVEVQVIGKASGDAGQTCVDETVTKEVDVTKVFAGLPLSTLLPTEAVAGMKYIVVGGYMVNSMFPTNEASTFTDKLSAEGDKVVEFGAEGNLYVAGWTKEDTLEAVNEIIALLDSE